MNYLSFSKIRSKDINTNIYIGSILLAFSIFDVLINAFLKVNITSALPENFHNCPLETKGIVIKQVKKTNFFSFNISFQKVDI